MSVIESDEYRHELKRLMRDPIIVAMASQPNLQDVELESWDFISAASDEYHKRGGKHARSIGGPARAIRALVKPEPGIQDAWPGYPQPRS